MLGGTKRPFPHGDAIQTVTYLLKLLRRGIHGVLHALWLGLQRNQLAVVGREIGLRRLQIVQQLRHARLKLAQRQRGKRFSGFIVVIDVAERIQRLRSLTHVLRRLSHLLSQLGRFGFDAIDLVQRFQGFRQILLNEFLLGGEIFLLIQGVEFRLNLSTRGSVTAVVCTGIRKRCGCKVKQQDQENGQNRMLRAIGVQHSLECDVRNDRK